MKEQYLQSLVEDCNRLCEILQASLIGVFGTEESGSFEARAKVEVVDSGEGIPYLLVQGWIKLKPFWSPSRASVWEVSVVEDRFEGTGLYKEAQVIEQIVKLVAVRIYRKGLL